MPVEPAPAFQTRIATGLSWVGRFLVAPAGRATLGASAAVNYKPSRPSLEPFHAPPAEGRGHPG